MFCLTPSLYLVNSVKGEGEVREERWLPAGFPRPGEFAIWFYMLSHVGGSALAKVTPMLKPPSSFSVPPPQLHPNLCSAQVGDQDCINKI